MEEERLMKRMYISANLMLIVFTSVLTASAAAQKPDFSGTWQLNTTKSFMAADHPASNYQLTKVVEQKGNEVTMTDVAVHSEMANIPLPDSKTTNILTPDGKEHQVKGASMFPGMPAPTITIVCEWQGDTLAVNERGGGFGGPSTTNRRYYLSADGSELIELLDSHSTYGDTEQRLIFDKHN
jgi:hypothetical protein